MAEIVEFKNKINLWQVLGVFQPLVSLVSIKPAMKV